jgi:hypothetical protein
MYSGRTVFSQLVDLLPRHELNRCIQRYQGNRNVRTFSSYDHFLCMAFAQITFRESLRDIEACLRALGFKLYHAGIRGRVSRSTLADANENRDWRIWADFAQVLIHTAKRLYANEDLGFELEATVYALDSTTIDLCLSLFPWARFRRTKGAAKLHTLLNLRGNIPEFIYISEGRLHDVNVLDILIPEPGSYYLMDRGYVDFERLYTLHQATAIFVTRAKRGFQCRRRYSHPVDKSTGLRCDQTVILTGGKTRTAYPEPLRRIAYFDVDTGNRYVFLTNNFSLPPLVVAQLYKARWQIELFFKWIKQHLRIKAFYGTSANAVKTQIWIAICVYVLVAILKKQLKLEQNLYTILQVLSLTLFEKAPILQVLSRTDYVCEESNYPNQLLLFKF